MKHLQKKESACHDVTILQHIPADQLAALKTTYEFMLTAINDALRNQKRAAKQSAEIARIGKTMQAHHRRTCLKIAAMQRRGQSIPEISIRFACNIGSPSDIKRLASVGRGLFKAATVQARKNHIIHCHRAGIGPRPAARSMPAALGTCSSSYACKIVKDYRMRDQSHLPFPLAAV